jgi:predicted phage tail protein
MFGAFHPEPILIEATNIWDAVEAVTMQIAGFQPDPVTGHKVVKIVGFDTVEAMKRYDTETVDIHIMPALAFGKDAGLTQIIIGVVLIAAAIASGGTTLPLLFGSAGLSMVLGGVMQMMSPQPQLNSGNEEAQRSRYLPSQQNTVAIGTTIPLLYGKYRVPGHILSLNIDATDTGI